MPELFNLNLELTRLVPLGLATSDAVMNLARSLRNSGSDIVTEEDLATVLGRLHIAPQVASSFRTVVARSDSSVLEGALGITLEAGPGPTVIRALKQPPFLAMVVQCSLLTYVHEKDSLATVLARVFEQELEKAPPGQTPRAIPSHEALFGVLQACQDQTSSYHWRGLILATAATLGIREEYAFKAMPENILQGAIHMFPLVQSLPDDRMILIDLGEHNGACSLAVWAHHVLGLTIMVKQFHPSDQICDKQLGIGKVHVVLDLRDQLWNGDLSSSIEMRLPSITLMSVAEGETLIALKTRPVDDGTEIDATYRRFAADFGRKTLQSVCGEHKARHALVHELTMLTVAFAAIICEQLFAKPRSAFSDGASVPRNRNFDSSGNASSKGSRLDSSDDHEIRSEIEHRKLPMPQQKLIKAARFLFDNPNLSKSSTKGHVSLYSGQPLNAELRMPD